MSPSPLGPAAIALVLLLAFGGCGGDGGDGGSGGDGGDAPTQTEETEPEEPAASVTLKSSDDRPSKRDELVSFGKRTTLRGRAVRDGAPLADASIELTGDPHPFGRPKVIARTTTDAAGRFATRERFDTTTRVRVHLDGAPGPTVLVRRGIDAVRARVDTQPDGRQLLVGTMRYPRDVEPRFRFRLFVGPGNRPRLKHRPAKARFEQLGPGRGRVSVLFRAPEGRWEAKLCVFPAASTGLSGPRVGCRGASTPNEAYEEDRKRRRREDTAGRR